MEVFDILLDETGDVLIENGDLVIGESTQQHQQLLLLSNKGDWKQSPFTGVGIVDYLLSDDDEAELVQEITKQFSTDGMNVELVSIDNGNLKVIAEYI